MLYQYEELKNSAWIGVPKEQYSGLKWNGRLPIQCAYFRKNITIDGLEGLDAVLNISAVSRYRLYINGVSVLAGPCKGDRWRQYFETLNIAKYLKAGKNIIAVKVVAYPPVEAQELGNDEQGPFFSWNFSAGPCLVVGGAIERQGHESISLNTGETEWYVKRDRAIGWVAQKLSFWMGVMEKVQAELLPPGWCTEAMDKGEWSPAEARWPTLYNPWGEIYPFPLRRRPIPLLEEAQIEFKREMPCRLSAFETISFDSNGTVEIAPHTRAQAELDVGYLTTAYLLTQMKGGKAAKITFKYAESYALEGDNGTLKKGRRDDSENYCFIGHEDVFYADGREVSYEPFWFRTFRFLRLEIETGAEPLLLHLPRLMETGYPLPVHTTFSSSDKSLEAVWDLSVRTLRRCMHETYEDCPYYEQMQYTFDTRLQILFTYALGGDTRLALRAIEDYHASMLPEGILQSRYPTQLPQVIPMFSLQWIFMLEDYYEQTADATVPRRYRPTVDAVLDWHERYTGPIGLIEYMDYWQQLDWVEEWDDTAGVPHAAFTGPSAAHNLIYAYAMQAAARLNRITGREGCAADYEARARRILELVEETCFDKEAGIYREGPQVAEYSQHTQVFAVLTGLAQGRKAEDILMAALEREDMRKCSFPMMFSLIRALEKIGRYELTARFFDTIKGFADLGATTIPETPFSPRSECHAWGAFPLYEFPRALLGVKPGAIGWKEILIEPHFICAKSCKGSVYTPKGMVEVAWEKRDGQVHLSGQAPQGVKSILRLPDGTCTVLLSGGAFAITL